MKDFAEREPVPPNAGENAESFGGTNEFHHRVLTVARDNIKRTEFWSRRGFELTGEVEKLVKAGKVAKAIGLVIKELAVTNILQDRRRDRLELQIASLEPKPRVRVKAIQQVIV